MRLERKDTLAERLGRAYAKGKHIVVEGAKKTAPKLKSGAIAAGRFGVKAGKVAGHVGYEAFKQTKAGKRFERKRKKGAKIIKKTKKTGYHKKCKWVKD